MRVEFKGELRRVERQEFTKKDGSNGVGYKLLVECGADSLQFPTTEKVYQNYQDEYIYKGLECQFLADYNPRYQLYNFIVKDVSAL